jgi:hypothetical protein
MRRLVWFAIAAALASLAGGCADKYAPFSFKDHPGYTPADSKAPSDPRHTPTGFVPGRLADHSTFAPDALMTGASRFSSMAR